MRTRDELEPTIDRILAGAGIPGCSIAVTTTGSDMLWFHCFGYADLETSSRAGPSTIYHLFSGTKLFTATAIMKLVEDGLLGLDDPVTRYLPDLPQLEGIRLRHLLSHSSGLKETLRAFLAVYFDGEKAPTAGEALSRYSLRRSSPPGRKVRYRNVNYAVLGELVSRVSGVPYRDYVRRCILEPLGSDAKFEIGGANRESAATGYLRRRDPMRLLLRFLMPSVSSRLRKGSIGGLVALNPFNLSTSSIGGLVGSVRSFAPFLRSQLNGGAPILSEEMARRMQTLEARGRAGIASREGVGLGWKIGRSGHHSFLNHEGSGAGFTSEMRIYPDAGLGVALAMNLSSMAKTMQAAHRICEVLYQQRESFPGSA